MFTEKFFVTKLVFQTVDFHGKCSSWSIRSDETTHNEKISVQFRSNGLFILLEEFPFFNLPNLHSNEAINT